MNTFSLHRQQLHAPRRTLRLLIEQTVGRDPYQPAPFQEAFEEQFRTMKIGYRATGGFAYGDDVASLMPDRVDQPVSVLARAIVARRVVSFEWRQERLLPLFQFEAHDMSIHPATLQVIGELCEVFDDWEMALWFAHSNVWLHDEVPADLIRLDPAAVLEAARADRFIACG